MSVKIKIDAKRCFPCHLFNNHTQCIQMMSFFLWCHRFVWYKYNYFCENKIKTSKLLNGSKLILFFYIKTISARQKLEFY